MANQALLYVLIKIMCDYTLPYYTDAIEAENVKTTSKGSTNYRFSFLINYLLQNNKCLQIVALTIFLFRCINLKITL